MTPQTMRAFNQLAMGEFYDRYPDKVELLKGTPFYVKRTTLTGKQLQNKPLYRTISLLNKVALSLGIPENDWRAKGCFRPVKKCTPISLLNKVALSLGIPENDWRAFLDWSEATFTQFERDHHDEVQKFIRTYGSQYKFQHLLLTNRNAINLFIKEHIDR